MQEDPEFARRALRAGAAGYVLKEAADDELVEAVRRAADGGTYLNPRLGAVLAAAPPEPSGPPDDLTEREVEVLRLIALGHTNAEIAAAAVSSRCAPSSPTARTSSRSCGRSTRAELVRYALDHGFVKARVAGSAERAAAPGRPSRPRRRAATLELAAGELDALAHAGQPEAVAGRGLGVEADAVVGDATPRTASPAQRTVDVDRGGVARA